MNLQFLKLDEVERLTREVGGNHQVYIDGKTSELVDEKDCAVSRFEIGEPPDLLYADGSCKSDFDASKLVYQWLSALNPVQAADGRLWTLLTHRELGAYTHVRWSGDRLLAAENKSGVILDRWFYRGSSLRTSVHNAISRLWWFSYLTYDEERDDPFELTEVLLSLQEIPTALLERSIGPCKRLLVAALEALTKIKKSEAGSKLNGTAIQAWGKDLHLLGGVFLLDTYPPDRLVKVCEQRLRSKLAA